MNVDSILISQFAVLDQGLALTVVRTFNHLETAQLPARIPLMSISVLIHAHSSECGTSHHFELVLVSAKQGRITTVVEGDFVLSAATPLPGMPLRHEMVFNVMHAEFPTDGPYAFELYIDGTYHAAAAFFIALTEK